MTLPLVWTDDATRDLLEIADHLVPRKFAAAQRLIAIRHAVETLPDHPRHYRVTGTSEILAILHARQRSPEAPPPPATPH